MHAAPSRALVPIAALLVVLGATCSACGGKTDGGTDASDTNRVDWKQTFDAAMDALARADYRAMHDLLTPTGRTTLEADLKHFSRMLNDPVAGPRMLGKIRAQWPEVPQALIDGAKAARLEDAWTLVLHVTTPQGVTPRLAGMKIDPGAKTRMELKYRYGEGTGHEIPIELLRIGARWSVDKIGLGNPP